MRRWPSGFGRAHTLIRTHLSPNSDAQSKKTQGGAWSGSFARLRGRNGDRFCLDSRFWFAAVSGRFCPPGLQAIDDRVERVASACARATTDSSSQPFSVRAEQLLVPPRSIVPRPPVPRHKVLHLRAAEPLPTKAATTARHPESWSFFFFDYAAAQPVSRDDAASGCRSPGGRRDWTRFRSGRSVNRHNSGLCAAPLNRGPRRGIVVEQSFAATVVPGARRKSSRPRQAFLGKGSSERGWAAGDAFAPSPRPERSSTLDRSPPSKRAAEEQVGWPRWAAMWSQGRGRSEPVRTTRCWETGRPRMTPLPFRHSMDNN